MHFTEPFIHHPARHFREPIINTREQREDRARRDDVMEVRNHVVSVVQVQIAEIEAQRQPGQPADAKHRQERHDKQHWRVETNRTAPQGKEHARQDDHRGNRNDHRRGLEKRCHADAHAGEIHVMRPDDEREESDRQR